MAALSEIADCDVLIGAGDRASVPRVTHVHRDIPVALSPVRAEKDPRVAPAGVDDVSALAHLGGVADALVALVRELLPHKWLDDAAYRLVVAKIDREPVNADIVRSGCAAVENNMGRSLAELTPDEIRQVLRSIEGGLFFRTLLSRSVRHLYDDTRVWAGCGYEGVHGCREGGAPREDIADATWLPEPALV